MDEQLRGLLDEGVNLVQLTAQVRTKVIDAGSATTGGRHLDGSVQGLDGAALRDEELRPVVWSAVRKAEAALAAAGSDTEYLPIVGLPEFRVREISRARARAQRAAPSLKQQLAQTHSHDRSHSPRGCSLASRARRSPTGGWRRRRRCRARAR